MAELAKIQRISFQWNITTSIPANTWHCEVINKQTLNMPDIDSIVNDLPINPGNVTYLVNITALGIDGTNPTNGAIKKTVSLSNINGILTTYPLPEFQTTELFINSNFFNVYIASHTVDFTTPPFLGSPSVTEENEINILLRTNTTVSSARIKVFAEIFAYGSSSL